jgi:hypothetical protein
MGTFTKNGSTNSGYATYAYERSNGMRRRKPKGWIPPTGYNFKYLFITCQEGKCSYQNDFVSSTCTGLVGADPNQAWFNGNTHYDLCCTEAAAVADDEGLVNRALIKARNKLKSSDINLGVAFAERKLTARLVGDTTVRLAKSLRQLRRGEIRSAMRTLGIANGKREPRGGSVPQKWLELQYGWKPLLSDVYGACDALSKRDKKDWSVVAKGSARSTKVLLLGCKLGEAPFYYSGANVVTRIERGAFVRIDAQPANEVLISLGALGLTNPALIAWELVPFSFVVDWFLPIGGWLESLDATLGFQILGCSTSYFVKANWDDSVSEKVSRPDFFNEVLESHYHGEKRIVYLERSVSNTVPLPQFPSLKDGGSLLHMANGLALLTQVFGRRR